eukprot:TRINITY_DN3059_c0_g1_i12.p1 TRINITY_DN3059_c0_g1~~TRINITY_DN3059_c0_g1_i12.p1  ORF type:complete len:879 (-),score=153.19 TRINITY_DN3059_c0_g1_i12:520-3156(-)
MCIRDRVSTQSTGKGLRCGHGLVRDPSPSNPPTGRDRPDVPSACRRVPRGECFLAMACAHARRAENSDDRPCNLWGRRDQCVAGGAWDGGRAEAQGEELRLRTNHFPAPFSIEAGPGRAPAPAPPGGAGDPLPPQQSIIPGLPDGPVYPTGPGMPPLARFAHPQQISSIETMPVTQYHCPDYTAIPANPRNLTGDMPHRFRKRKAPGTLVNLAIKPVEPHQYHPERATCGLGRPQRYRCDYCGHIKVSSSAPSDGAVRIRCPCGGMQGDGVNRMHAKWTLAELNQLEGDRGDGSVVWFDGLDPTMAPAGPIVEVPSGYNQGMLVAGNQVEQQESCGVCAINALLGGPVVDEQRIRNMHQALQIPIEQYQLYGASAQVILSILSEHGIGQQLNRVAHGHPGFTCSLDPKVDQKLLLNNGSHWTTLCKDATGWVLHDDGKTTEPVSDAQAIDYVRQFSSFTSHWVLPLKPVDPSNNAVQYAGPALAGYGQPDKPSGTEPQLGGPVPLPSLNKSGYGCLPHVQELQALGADKLGSVAGFKLFRPGFGSLEWEQPVDLTGADLNSIEIEHGKFNLDAKQLPSLNSGCVVMLQGMWPRQGSTISEIMDFPGQLQRSVEAYGADFLGYGHHNGELRLRTNQFLSEFVAIATDSTGRSQPQPKPAVLGVCPMMRSAYPQPLPLPQYRQLPGLRNVPPMIESMPAPGYQTQPWAMATTQPARGRKRKAIPGVQEFSQVQPHEYHPERATCGLGRPQRYRCDYCGHIKVSSSACSDGAVRIRCPCGGMQGDGVNRMHAKWSLNDGRAPVPIFIPMGDGITQLKDQDGLPITAVPAIEPPKSAPALHNPEPIVTQDPGSVNVALDTVHTTRPGFSVTLLRGHEFQTAT